MSSQIARLTTVAHVLYDREVLELRQENERLKQENSELNMKFFWQEYGLKNLHHAMTRVFRRRDFDYIPNNYEWIRPLIESCGLTLVFHRGDFDYIGEYCEWMRLPIESCGLEKPSYNTHFVCLDNCNIVAYDAKLLKAKSVDDPELLKLKALFKVLKDMYDAPYTHTTT